MKFLGLDQLLKLCLISFMVLTTSCNSNEVINLMKDLQNPNPQLPVTTPESEPPVIPPVTPPVAPPDPIETGSSTVLDYNDPICVNYRALTFDYSNMPEYDIQDNVIVSTYHGGTAEVKEIGVATGTGSPYRSDLSPSWGCTSSWYPGGSICQPVTDTSDSVTSGDQGATWNNHAGGTLMVGYIIIDLGEAKTIVGFDLFQMFSDGKTTHAQIFAHSDLGATLPAQLEAGWTEVTSGMTALGAGELTGSQYGGSVSRPLRLPLSSPLTVRYLKVHTQNNGCLGSQSYTELRSIRGYSKTVN